MRRTIRRPLLAVALVVAAGVTWAALLPGLTLPVGRTAAAAPVVPSGSSPAASLALSASSSTSPSGPTASPSPVATPTPTPAPTPTPTPLPVTIGERRAALSATLLRLRATYGIPGVSAAMTFPDGTTWIAKAGFADVAAHRVVTPTTAFAAGSISKTFTAALIMRLAEEGRLSLDATVRTYLPKLVINPTITIRQLLDHTSGLDDFFSHATIDSALLAHPRRVWTAADSLSLRGQAVLQAGDRLALLEHQLPGPRHGRRGGRPRPAGQPNSGSASSIRWGSATRSTSVSRSRVDRSLTAIASASPNPRQKGIDVSDGTAIIPFTSVVTAAGGAGSIATTASDLVRWARALYGGAVLRPETLASMVDDAALTTELKSSVPYGLGVQVVTIDGRQTLGHSGRLLGFRAVMRWLPAEGIAVAVMTNQSRTDPNVLVRDLLRSVIGVPPPCTACPPPLH